MQNLNIPIYRALRQYADSNPGVFHMPGHKLGRGIPEELRQELAELDVTEIPGTDNLHQPEGVILEAQRLASRAFGAERTWFLVNGSTGGIHAVLLTICKPGDKLIVGRDCHRSVVAGMMLAGVRPVYIKPGFNREFGIPTAVTVQDVERTMKEHPDAVAVFLTRPNYYGICADLEAIARVVHERGKILAVDEAHGTHFCFHPALPVSALQAGADLCVQSAHKTLPALTQSAYLHCRGERVDREKLSRVLALLQSSSPSYLLMAFLDIARALMESRGRQQLEGLLRGIGDFEVGMEQVKGFKLLRGDQLGGLSLDRTRLVVNVKGWGGTGYEAEQLLREQAGIQAEMSDLSNVVFISTVADGPEELDRLCKGLLGLKTGYGGNRIALPQLPELPLQPPVLEPGEAAGRETEFLPMEEACGKVCAVIVTPYPPGIPVLFPGERVTPEAVQLLKTVRTAGGKVNGLEEDGTLCMVK